MRNNYKLHKFKVSLIIITTLFLLMVTAVGAASPQQQDDQIFEEGTTEPKPTEEAPPTAQPTQEPTSAPQPTEEAIPTPQPTQEPASQTQQADTLEENENPADIFEEPQQDQTPEPADPSLGDPTELYLEGSEIQNLSEEDVLAYWTDERMREAKPIDFYLPDNPSHQQAPNQPEGPLFVSPGEESTIPYQNNILEKSVTPLGYSYPPPFTRREVFPLGLYNWYPYRTIGKIFGTIPGKGNYVCSGSVMVGRSILTAGHCVYSPGIGYHTNLSFVPAYRDGLRPFGTYVAFNRITLNGWAAGNNGYDIGALAVGDINGLKIAQRIGNLGMLANASPEQHWDIFGYPAGAPFNGFRNWNCSASLSRRDPRYSPQPVGAGCDLTGGSSGGPWILNLDWRGGSGRNLANGVMSYGYTCCTRESFSPYFGNGAISIYNWGAAR
ncbi:MAG: hypothetical protein KDJ65_35780 [Anaerolineae bacterium]|nr:hypothetical protein [Anaerolineae bacterium]